MGIKARPPLSAITQILSVRRTEDKHLDFMPEKLSSALNEKLRKTFSLINFIWNPQVAYNIKVKFSSLETEQLEKIADIILKGCNTYSNTRINNAFKKAFGEDFRGKFTPGSDLVVPISLQKYSNLP